MIENDTAENDYLRQDEDPMPNEIANWRTAARLRIAAKHYPPPSFQPDVQVDPDSHRERRNRQIGYFDLLAFDLEFDFAVTIQFGEPLNERQIKEAVKRSGAMFDSHWLGRSWAKRASQERTFFVAVVERGKKKGNAHVHMLLRRPSVAYNVSPSWREKAQPRALSYILTERARRMGICPHGDVKIQRISDQAGAASYALKDLSGRNSVDPILSSEFHAGKRNSRVTATRA